MTAEETALLPVRRAGRQGPRLRGFLLRVFPDAVCHALDTPSSLGSAPESTIPLAFEGVSRRHARITKVGDAFVLEDLESRNGTYVDGERVTRIELRHGAIVRLGGALLVFDMRAEPWQPDGDEIWVGGSAYEALRRQARLIGPTDARVLIEGESGTGKELLARALHASSGRGGRWVAVNCATIPNPLAESELFGHVGGAFTGAKARRGLFAEAEGGTLFLDEIGDLPEAVQPKLLRILEERTLRPVGADRGTPIDVRVLAATHRPLESLVDSGAFRADLFARIAQLRLRLPPLREHLEDVPALARAILRRQGCAPTLDIDTAEALMLHDWPRNVRELEGVILHAALGSGCLDADRVRARLPPPRPGTSRGDTRGDMSVSPRDAPRDTPRAPGAPTPSEPSLREALREAHGQVTRLTEVFGISRAHLYRLFRRYAIDPKEYR